MQLHSVRIGELTTPNNVFLAPLAGYTNAVFRSLCKGLGAGLTFTEMVSAKGLCYDSSATRELLLYTPDYVGVKAIQLFGNEPYFLEKAACSEELSPFGLIDINMGCPVPKIFKNGEGSALLENVPLAKQLVSACKKSGKAVSVKFRIGLTADKIITADFAKAMEDAGADMITVHGRTRDKMYSGEVDYAQIAAAKRAVAIPVIANGGIFTAADADKLMDETGADGVMIARGAMYNPWLFAQITNTPTGDRRGAVLEQIEQTRLLYGERFATEFMRKRVGFYLKGSPGAAALRVKLLECKSCGEIMQIVGTLNF